MEANPERAIENKKQKWNRLSKLEFEAKQLLKKEMNKEYYKQYDFKP